MNPELWRRVEELFHAALGLSPDARPAFLEEACGEDAGLKRHVERLLSNDEHGGSLLEKPILADVMPRHENEDSFLPTDEVSLASAGTKPSPIGTRVWTYEFVSLLGAGGMGEVYRAHDTKLERDVAIKVLPAALANDPRRVTRFQQEARTLAALNHPYIGAIYGLEETRNGYALVLELVEGPTLAQRLANGRKIPVQEALLIARQIAEALETAHDKGIIHRDLKPANIKVTPAGTVKVLDFGLAKAFASDSLTDLSRVPAGSEDGLIVGTPSYMSPEQARGQAVTKQTDIWAFGCVVYELLTGKQAFHEKTSTDTIVAVLEREPDWTQLPASVSPRLRDLLRLCLEKNARNRRSTAADVRIDIELALKEPVAEPALSAPAKSRRAWLPWAAAVLAAVSAAWVVLRPVAVIDNPLANAQFTRLTDFPGTEEEAAVSPDGRFVVFLADRDGPPDVFLTQVGTGRFINLTQGNGPLIGRTNRAVGFSGDGSEVWFLREGAGPIQIMPLLSGKPRAFLGTRSMHVAWTPDGSRMVYHTSDPGDPMFVADVSGDNARQIFVGSAGRHNHFPVWSPDGRWIYFTSGNPIVNEMDLWRISSAGGMPERLTHQNSPVAYPTPISNTTVLYVARDSTGAGPWLWALDVERNATRRISLGVEKYSSIAASADGRRLAATVGNPTATLWSVPILDHLVGESEVKPYPLPSVRALMPRFGPDALFYVSSQGAGDGLWRYQNGEVLEIWRGATAALLEPAAVSADGRRVAFVLRQNGSLRLHLETSEGTESRDLASTLAVRGTPCWSPDGKWIVIGGDDGKGDGLFKIPVEGGAAVRIATGPAANPVWSPDGTIIVYAGANVVGQTPLLAVRPDGARAEWPNITVQRDGERIRFLPSGKSLVYMQGPGTIQDFWILDIATKTTRQLAHLTENATMRTFDITADGKQIVFDRLRENSDIVLIDLPK
jgi:serine/threonine protein kinase/Tol biopolymer transport system component